MKVRVSPSELAATLESTARTFNLPPHRVTADRRDAGLCLVDNKTGRELCGYRLTTREMDAALTIAAALADISPAIVQPTATPFALQEGAIFLSAAQVAEMRRALDTMNARAGLGSRRSDQDDSARADFRQAHQIARVMLGN